MSEPELTLEKLLELRLPRLDPAQLPLRAIRRDPKSASFEWLTIAGELVPSAPEAAEAARHLTQ